MCKIWSSCTFMALWRLNQKTSILTDMFCTVGYVRSESACVWVWNSAVSIGADKYSAACDTSPGEEQQQDAHLSKYGTAIKPTAQNAAKPSDFVNML